MVNNAEFYPLSQPQKSIWFLEKSYFGTSINIIAGTLRFKTRVDFSVLEEAINLFIKKNDSMRLRIVEQDGEPRQYVSEYSPLKFDCFDFSFENGLNALYAWDSEQTKIPFKLIDSDLFYCALIRISDNDGGFYLKLHHLISDAWTMSLVGKMVMEYYSSLIKGNPISEDKGPSFIEHLFNEEKYENSARFQNDMKYWNEKFEIYPEPTLLKPQAQNSNDTRAKRKTLLTPQKLSNKIREYCAANDVSVFTLFMSALSIYINRVTGNEDIILGTTILNRINAREKETTGMFVSVAAPVRIRINDSDDFNTFANAMLKESLSILRHQKYPYNYLIRDLKTKHKLPGRLFDIVLNYQNTKFNQKETNIEYSTRWHFTGHQAESLIIHINDRDDQGNLILDYDYLASVYNVKEIEFIHQHVISLLWHALDNPLRKISKLEMLSEKEKQRILYDFNNTKADFPQDKTLNQMFEEQVEKTPDNAAVIFGDSRLTYRELNEKANQIARILRNKGVKADTIVGISVYRSFEMIIGLLGILKAGGAYLPIDPDYPEDRIKYMLHDSGARLLLVQGNLVDKYQSDAELIDLADKSVYTGNTSNLAKANGSKDLAYVIYTSGSSGRPKGVMVEHISVINRLNWAKKKYPINETTIILQKTPFTFDVSVWELFWWLFVGAAVCMLEPDGEKDPVAIIAAVEKNKITAIHFVPPMLSAFLNYVETRGCANRLSSLKYVFCSGEALTIIQAESFNRLLNGTIGTKLFNLYGPTETTVEVSYFDCSPSVTLKAVPIGRPIDNIRMYILDKNRNLLPVGIPGELYVGGIGLARGYINNPDLTAEKFVPDPYFEGEKIYKTGDRVRWFPEGDIEYLGRIDFQVKIRGFRIELGEIESRLLAHESVKEAVVVGQVHNNNNYLCAYAVMEKPMQIAWIRDYLSKDLPDYMIPSFFVFLDILPLSPNGKVDRKALPLPDFSKNIEEEFAAPGNEMEKTLADIWCDVLGIDKISVNESFMNLGGDSLRAIALITEIHKRLNIELSVREIFRYHTVRHLSEHLLKAEREDFAPIPKIAEKESYAMSSAQKRLFILNQMEEDDLSYNLPGVVSIEGAISKEQIEMLFKALIERHESLRTSFELKNGQPVQKIHKTVDFEVCDFKASENEVGHILKAFVRPFDLKKAPLIRVGFVTLEKDRHLLFFDMHHIIADGTSVNILIKELTDLYALKELPELKATYKDYSAWHNGFFQTGAMKEQEQYWLNQFSGEIPVLDMPTDFPRAARKSSKGKRLSFSINEKITSELKRIAMETGATLYMVLLASYTVLLSKYTAQEDIIVGVPVEGRLHADLKNLIGMFVNTLAVRNFPKSDKTFLHYLQEVKETLLKAYENQEYPFEELVEKTKVKRDLGRNPLFDTVFVLENLDLTQIRMEGLTFSPYSFDSGTSKFDLTLEAYDHGGQIDLVTEYCTDLFEEETVRNLLGHFSNILHGVAGNPTQKIADISMLSEEEKHQLLFEFNNTAVYFPRDKTIHQMFEEQAQRTPDNIAVVYGSKTLTYRELNERANQLAKLLRKKGIGPDQVVGVSLYRSFEMITGLFGILKSGGAYLPIDPDYPEDRISYMLENSGAKLLLTQKDLLGRFEFPIEKIVLEDPSIYSGDGSNPEKVCGPKNLAYVMYTSGSTGRPKGAMVEHLGVINRINAMQRQYPIDETCTLLQKTTYTFDVCVWEQFWWSFVGAKMCVLKPFGEKDPEAIIRAIEENHVTMTHFVPSMMSAFLNYVKIKDSAGRLSCLKRVFCSGEAVSVSQVELFHKLLYMTNGTRLSNLYGPTETTVDASYYDCLPEATLNTIPIGRPIDNVRLYILDKNRKLLPVGVPGELYIGGVGVGRGYINNAELTAEKFVADPFIPGEIIYRTGDRVRWLSDGEIEFLGRIDFQVKIRGFRIELGEIEATLLAHEAVKEAVAVGKSHSESSYLCAYYTAEKEIPISELREHCSKKLPEYMVPSFFVRLDTLPLSPNGKVDRKALPAPIFAENTENKQEAPQSKTEKDLAAIWCDVLAVGSIGVDDNFFDLGGDSLTAINVISRLHGNITVLDLYENPTVRLLAAKIETYEKGKNILIRFTAGSEPEKTSIVCFPYGGGSAAAFKAMGDAFSKIPGYSLYAVNAPGHDIGSRESLKSVNEVAALAAYEIENRIDGKIILYSHCAGSALLVETARLLEKKRIPVECLFIGGSYPPKSPRFFGRFFNPWKLIPDKLVAVYLNKTGLPRLSPDNEYIGRIIKIFRHDVSCFYGYFSDHQVKKAQKLNVPIHCIFGEKDITTGNYGKRFKEWAKYSTAVSLHVIKNAFHYFNSSHADEVAYIIADELAHHPDQDSERKSNSLC